MNNQDAMVTECGRSRATVLSMSVEANTEPESASHTRSFVQRDFICPPQTANPSALCPDGEPFASGHARVHEISGRPWCKAGALEGLLVSPRSSALLAGQLAYALEALRHLVHGRFERRLKCLHVGQRRIGSGLRSANDEFVLGHIGNLPNGSSRGDPVRFQTFAEPGAGETSTSIQVSSQRGLLSLRLVDFCRRL